MAFFKAQQIIEIIQERIGLNKENYAIYQIFEKTLGKLAKNTKIIGIKEGTIWVIVEAPVYLQELFLIKKEIITKINQYLGNNKIKDIKFKIDTFFKK